MTHKITYVQLNYKSTGQGPALLILHGLFGSLDNWATHAKILAENYSVYLIDQRNHGKSPHSEQWSYADMAEDLHEFLDDQGIYQSHILGHSMGGKTAMLFAAMYPERVDKLIVADMTPKAYPRHHDDILFALSQVPLASLRSRQEAEELMSGHIQDAVTRQFLLKGLHRDHLGNFSWKFNLPVIDRLYNKVIEAIEIDFPIDKPALFIYGGLSHYLEAEDIPRIKTLFPEAVFKEIPEAGHWLHAEVPDKFLGIVRDFLK